MKFNTKTYQTRYLILAMAVALGIVSGMLFSVPWPLFDDPYSFVLFDREGRLLGARIAADGQWRFPEMEEVPEKYRASVLAFEDNRYAWHPGIDPVALGRAIIQNARAKKVVSGGSTLTMQLARMARSNPPRTVGNKLVEMWMAMGVELRYPKGEILAKYASHAPFGGNVVGLEMASYRYFGKRPDQLSWAESATLAVLPNSPALIHPGRNRDKLREKRDQLLDRLYMKGQLDSLEWTLSKLEPIPEHPEDLPDLAPHFLEFAKQQKLSNRISSTLDPDLQKHCTRVARYHRQHLSENAIENVGILVLDTRSGEVLAYVGNAPGAGVPEQHVDMIQANRSSGSILKPLLYGGAWDRGFILPGTLLEDVPVSYNGYKPENYHRKYDGMVAADEALIRSLNVPAVGLLKAYGVANFQEILTRSGLTTIRYAPDHYGLTLVLGGAEVKLWELTNAYAGLCRTLLQWEAAPNSYHTGAFDPPVWRLDETMSRQKTGHPPVMGAGASWVTLNSLQAVERPNEDGAWEHFSSTQRIAWKTGTSYGFRDAWAVGVNPDIAIGIWVGNANGEGRPGIIGSQAAAPILFEVLSYFDHFPGFPVPYDDLEYGVVCRTSGFLSSRMCPVSDTILIPRAGLHSGTCAFHQEIHVQAGSGLRASVQCADGEKLESRPWFVLPPGPAWYYSKVHPEYLELPAWAPECAPRTEAQQIAILYPGNRAKIGLPVELDGKAEPAILKAVHRDPGETIHWHLDGAYLASTRDFHSVALHATPGKHQLVVVDNRGNRDVRHFEIVAH